MYMAPTGYTLNGDTCYRDTTSEVVKIVPKSETGDYSDVVVPDVTSYELIDTKEVSTEPYSAIKDTTLICDVRDGATLNESNECSATLRLVPNSR